MADAALFTTILIGTLAVASLLRWLLQPVQGKPGTRLDARGLLFFVPLLVLFFLGASREALAPIIGALALYLFVAVTDVLETPPITRIAFVATVAVALTTQGVAIDTFKLPGTSIYYPLGWFSPVITAAWLLLCASLFGRAGSIPSVSFGIAALSGLTFYVVCWLVPWATGDTAPMLALAIAGVSLAQLLSCGQIRGGAAGPSSYGMGLLIGSLAVTGALKHTASLVALLPLFVISVPLFGATFTYASGLREGWRGLHIGQRRRHLHELLLEQGYSQSQVFGVLIGVAAYMCALGILLVLLIAKPFWVKLLTLMFGISVGPFVFFVILRMLRHEPQPSLVGGPPAVNLFNVRLHAVTMEEALTIAESFIREGGPHMIVTSDTSSVVRAQDDEELRAIINEADLVTADGQGVIVAARLLNLPISARVSGVDMMERLCAIAARLGKPVYLLGAAPGVAREAADRLQDQYAGLLVAGCRDGYFSEDEEAEVVRDIQARRPAVLFVAMGIPKQEKWIKRHLEELGVPVCIGVGGSFDVIAGHVRRAPVWMRHWGLEWLYRTLQRPRRLPRLAALPRMFVMTLHSLLFNSERPETLPVKPDCTAKDRC